MIIILNKPFNVLCQFTDSDGRETLKSHIKIKGLYPAGRLDRDSEGLLVLTDEGDVQHLISHPRHKINKTYWAQVEGIPTDEALSQLAQGVLLKDGVTAPAKVKRLPEPAIWPRHPPIRVRESIPTSWIELTISEGKNRQVRRMTAAVGYPTLRLVRFAVGPWTIDGLTPGEFRQVSLDDLLENAPLARQWRRMAQSSVKKSSLRQRQIAKTSTQAKNARLQPSKRKTVSRKSTKPS